MLFCCKQHSLVPINRQSSHPTLILRRHCDKYSSKLDISRSFIRIFSFALQSRNFSDKPSASIGCGSEMPK